MRALIAFLALAYVGVARADGSPMEVSTEGTGSLDWLGPSISLRGSYWSEDKRFTDAHDFSTGSAWLELRPKEWEGFKGYFSGYVQGEDLSRTPIVTEEAREAYIERSVGEWDFRVGRQIIVWGRADKLNPTDNLSVHNYRLLVTDDEDQRLGTFAASAAWNLGYFRAIGVWAPEWRTPGLPIPPLAPGVSLVSVTPGSPELQYGLKLDHSGGDVDF